MIFKEHINREQSLSDLLNYAHFIEDGIILNKDGAFLVAYQYRGPDIQSSSPEELDALSANINRMMNGLEDGWMIHVDELRIPSLEYSPEGHFPNSVARLIDEERRERYESQGIHYENIQFLTFVWKFPLPIVKTTRHWFVEGLPPEEESTSFTQLLKYFQETIERCLGLLSQDLFLEKLNSPDLLAFLQTCISGEFKPIAVPPHGTFLDVTLARHPVVGGYVPKIGSQFIYVLSLVGYLNAETVPGLLEELVTYPLVYRWSNRFIPLSEATAEREIKRYQKNWNNKVKGFWGIVKEVISGRPSEKLNMDAQSMSEETTEALTVNSNRTVRFGYWTSVLVLMHSDESILEKATQHIKKYVEQSGFSCILEDVNAFDAWLGSIPGHGSCNVRRLFMHSLNLAHVLPWHGIWSGQRTSAPSSLLPQNSPPVFYAATTGQTPFRYHMDVEDVGHQMVIGPTGAGKSTFLGFLIAQFLRYRDAQIFVFDKDASHHALTLALKGHHYDIGNAEKLAFCPLKDLSSETKKMRAKQWIETLVVLQNVTLKPDIRHEIHRAVESLSHYDHDGHRNLTIFCSEVQHEEVRAALSYYTLKGSLKLLDATSDAIQTGYLHTFEMNWLLSQPPEVYLPVLMYIFDQIESRLEEAQGSKPTLIVLEEAWLYLSHEIFAKKLKDWLKTLRKKNARVIFATQSLTDLYDAQTKTLTSATAAMMESCPTRVFLPNPMMETETRELYQRMGLSSRQIEMIEQMAIPKRHYYVVTRQGNRLIDLAFQPNSIALSFIGLSKEKSKQLVDLQNRCPDAWLSEWLQMKSPKTSQKTSSMTPIEKEEV